MVGVLIILAQNILFDLHHTRLTHDGGVRMCCDLSVIMRMRISPDRSVVMGMIMVMLERNITMMVMHRLVTAYKDM